MWLWYGDCYRSYKHSLWDRWTDHRDNELVGLVIIAVLSWAWYINNVAIETRNVDVVWLGRAKVETDHIIENIMWCIPMVMSRSTLPGYLGYHNIQGSSYKSHIAATHIVPNPNLSQIVVWLTFDKLFPFVEPQWLLSVLSIALLQVTVRHCSGLHKEVER